MKKFIKLAMNLAPIAWGCLAVFCLLGAAMGKPQAPIVTSVMVVMWALMKILHEAFAGAMVLFAGDKDNDKL